ncbi:MAG: hypothetical protein HQK83_18485 [Fibrobacteria bacterium]|nr:hypothetical protein [Fibrobacteria bacterium]
MGKRQINISKWQDYRGKGQGVLIYTNTSKKTELPIRDILNEYKKGFQVDPNYETSTYNFLACTNSKLISSFFKNRRSYLFFGTSYSGTLDEFQKKYFLYGYMKIQKFLDMRKLHMRKWMEKNEGNESPVCVDLKECLGVYSEDMHFFHPEDCFDLTEEVMKSWGYSGRVAMHMKLTFSDDAVDTILEHFASKTPRDDEYIQAVDDIEAKKEAMLAEIAAAEAAEEELW